MIDFITILMDVQCAVVDPASLALALGITGVSTIGNYISQSKSNIANAKMQQTQNEFNAAEAEKQRAFQANMMAGAQQFAVEQESSRRLYNSPSAMIERGINPFIQSVAGSLSAGEQPNLGSTPQGASGATALTSQNHPFQFGDFSSNLSALSYIKGVDANSANQKSQHDKNVIENASELSRIVSPEVGRQYLNANLGVDGDLSNSPEYLQAWENYESMRIDNEIKNLSLRLQGQYSEKQIQSALRNQDAVTKQVISETANGKELTEVRKKEAAANVARGYAEAFKLKREGEHYIADSKTIDAIRDAVVSEKSSVAFQQALNANSSFARWRGDKTYRDWYTSHPTLNAIRREAGDWLDLVPSLFIKGGKNVGKSTTNVFIPE